MARYVAAVVLVFGLLAGCATRSASKVPIEASGPDGSIDGGTSGESIVVPTEVLMGSGTSSTEAKQPEVPDSPAPEVDLTYKIGPGDKLNFRSFDDETLSMQVVVRYDGYVSFLVIPDLKIGGLSREEAEELLREEYSEFYVAPKLTLSIVETSSKLFTVLGEVTRPGEYPYNRPISLLDAITAAGGMRVSQRGGDSYMGATGQLVKATLIRPCGDDRQVLEYDISGFGKPGHSSAYTPVLPGDIVHVPESANLVYLLGEVRQPRVYAISEGLTLIRLLSLAGGYNESTARLRHVVVTREISDTETKLMTFDVRKNMKAGTDMLLQAGDIIYMPRKKLVDLADFIRRVTAPASAAMSFSQQVLGLYNQAYGAYYTKERYNLIYGNNTSPDLLNRFFQQDLTDLIMTLPALQLAP
ncbi:MAG: hypothetical protein GWP08_15170 [Nitrospiraceae bacterium]|nr:hypothetical protein [Nitrospiraceae bacterium]